MYWLSFWPYCESGVKALHKKWRKVAQEFFMCSKFQEKYFFLKGLSREILVHFFIKLVRFEGRNMSGSGLFFILMTFSC
jgi:hypothetical protein